jgi:nucleotide-binding universal stress UspA family protein
MESGPGVLVGFDGSPSAARAVRFAAEDAALRRRALSIVSVRETPGAEGPRPMTLGEAVGLAHGYLAADQVRVLERVGQPDTALIAAATGAELLVVGRGDVFRLGAALGSTALAVLDHAVCPVVTVGMSDPAAADPAVTRSGVLAGIRRLNQAEEILEVAFTEAELRGCGLEVVHAWRNPEPDRHGEMMFPVYDPVRYGAEQSERLAAVVAKLAESYPDVPVTIAAPHAGAVDAVLVAAEFASVVVLGKPRRGRIRELLLGSVGQKLLRQLDCPVIFVPGVDEN